MKRRSYDLLTMVMLVLFVAGLVFFSARDCMDFDAAFNLTSYQNLFQHQGFNHIYGSKVLPFAPSTGPELYFPVYLIWKLIGNTDFRIAYLVLVLYYIAFLCFFVFYLHRRPVIRLIVAALVVLFYLSNHRLFDRNVIVAPLGEFLAVFLFVAGFYFLYHRKTVPGLILLGLCLDVKSSSAFAVLPTLGIFIVARQLYPLWKTGLPLKKKWREILKIALLSSIVAVPTVAHSILIPEIALRGADKTRWKQERQIRYEIHRSNAMGQALGFLKQPSKTSGKAFLSLTREKWRLFQAFWGGHKLASIAYLIALGLFLFLSARHYSFYYFLGVSFFTLWWFFALADPWYRYYSFADFLFTFGTIILIAEWLQRRQTIRAAFGGLMIAGIWVGQFSAASIARFWRGESRQQMMSMAQTIQTLQSRKIYCLGWFQAPQLMLITGLRFSDIENPDDLKTVQSLDSLYLLTTPEDASKDEKLKDCQEYLTLEKQDGGWALYRIKDAEALNKTVLSTRFFSSPR